MRFWLLALAEPNRIAAQVLTTSPMKVRTLGLMRERASQRTIVSSRTPQARPKALVQLGAITRPPLSARRRFRRGWCSGVRISSSRLPLGLTTITVSPTFLLSRQRPMGEVVEILPVATSDSSLVTSLYCISSFFVLSKTLTVEPNPTLSWGMLFMLTMDRSAKRLPSWRTRALTNSWRCLAM